MEKQKNHSLSLLQDSSCVQLEHYSGPLDLLLQLIKQEEMNIFNINLQEITRQYLDHLSRIPKPDLEQAGNFIKVATLLIYIKSESLLSETTEEEESSDLKKDLTALLMTYQKFQELGQKIYARNLLRREVWPSGASWNLKPLEEDSLCMEPHQASFLLVKNYGLLLQKKEQSPPHKVPLPLPSLLTRIQALLKTLISGKKLRLSELSRIKKDKHSTFLTFLSVLELAKLGFVSLFQKNPFSDIEVVVKKTVDDSAFQMLEHEEEDWMSKKINEEAH